MTPKYTDPKREQRGPEPARGVAKKPRPRVKSSAILPKTTE